MDAQALGLRIIQAAQSGKQQGFSHGGCIIICEGNQPWMGDSNVVVDGVFIFVRKRYWDDIANALVNRIITGV